MVKGRLSRVTGSCHHSRHCGADKAQSLYDNDFSTAGPRSLCLVNNAFNQCLPLGIGWDWVYPSVRGDRYSGAAFISVNENHGVIQGSSRARRNHDSLRRRVMATTNQASCVWLQEDARHCVLKKTSPWRELSETPLPEK